MERLFLDLDRVLLGHCRRWPEHERSGVPVLEAGDQFCFRLAPEQIVAKGNERICARLRCSLEPKGTESAIKGTGAGP